MRVEIRLKRIGLLTNLKTGLEAVHPGRRGWPSPGPARVDLDSVRLLWIVLVEEDSRGLPLVVGGRCPRRGELLEEVLGCWRDHNAQGTCVPAEPEEAAGGARSEPVIGGEDAWPVVGDLHREGALGVSVPGLQRGEFYVLRTFSPAAYGGI